MLEIGYGRAFREKLGIREDLEAVFGGIGVQDSLEGFGCANW